MSNDFPAVNRAPASNNPSVSIEEMLRPKTMANNNMYTGSTLGKDIPSFMQTNNVNQGSVPFDLGQMSGLQNYGVDMTNIGKDTGFSLDGVTDFMGSDAFKNGLGAVNLGVGVMGYLDDRKTAKMNRELMGQQIANNATTAQNRALDRASLKMAFNPNSGLGK